MIDANTAPDRMKSFRPRTIQWGALAAYAALLAVCAAHRPPSLGESALVAAGIWNWRYNDFEPAREHAPLPRLVASAPAALLDVELEPYVSDGDPSNSQFSLGKDFLAQNGNRAIELLKYARWACIPFAVLGAWLCRHWATEIYGDNAGWLALFAWCVCPNVLARAHIVAPDVPAASLGLLAAYSFCGWLERPSYSRAYLAGLAAGLAILCKFIWLTLLVVWPILAIVRILSAGRAGRDDVVRNLAHGGVMLAAGLAVLNLGYRFEGFGTSLGSYLHGQTNATRRYVELSAAQGTPLPLPANFVLAIEDRMHAVQGKIQWESPRRERLQFAPFHYVLATLARTPLGFLLVGLIVTLARLRGFARTAWRGDSSSTAPDWLGELTLIASACAIWATAAMFSIFNYHVTHVFASLPFAYIWMSQAGRMLIGARRRWAALLVALLLWAAASSIAFTPNWLDYGNELAGGDRRKTDVRRFRSMQVDPDLLYRSKSLENLSFLVP